MEFAHVGNERIWDMHKTAFLCSRKVPAAQVLKCYDWAIAMRDAGKYVMLGAHSQLEKDVLHYLLKCKQPIVVVLARGMKKNVDVIWREAIAQKRMLVVAPFKSSVVRVSEDTASQRNKFMVEHAEDVVVGHASETGTLQAVLNSLFKPVRVLA